MENASVSFIASLSIQPEFRERYLKWYTESYFPQLVQAGMMKGIDRYQITKDNPEYPETVSLLYFQNIRTLHNWIISPFGSGVVKEQDEYVQKGLIEWFWCAFYKLERRFQGTRITPGKEITTTNAQIMHLEGYWLPTGEETRYETWFTRSGYELFVPLIMKLPGIKEYNLYRLLPYDSALPASYKPKDPEAHPGYLSIIYFENIEAFDNYDKSLELTAFRHDIQREFQRSLDYRWYAQYQLIQSWRK